MASCKIAGNIDMVLLRGSGRCETERSWTYWFEFWEYSMYHRLAMKKLTTTYGLSSKRFCFHTVKSYSQIKREELFWQPCEILMNVQRINLMHVMLSRPNFTVKFAAGILNDHASTHMSLSFLRGDYEIHFQRTD